MLFVTKAEAVMLHRMDVDNPKQGRGQRGIVNARFLELSKHRYRRERARKNRQRWR